MGGSVALTIRFSSEQHGSPPGLLARGEYRGSCHTNVLPDGLWDVPFYVDLDTSRKHAETWLDAILENRRANPEAEAMWGKHNMLAPIGYGIVIIDYVTSTLISAQGYSSPARVGVYDRAKFAAIRRAGLVDQSRDARHMIVGDTSRVRSYDIKMPFSTVRCGLENTINAEMQAWAEEHFGLSDAERDAWQKYIVEIEGS